MEVPFLSIVIPVYNAEYSISRTISSIVSQDYHNIEIIIINDGSTDQSFEICQKIALKEQRIKLFSIQNSGVSYARNVGIEQAKGKYITFLDADDYYCNDFLKVITSELEINTQLIIYGYNVVRDGRSIPFTIPLEEARQFSNKSELREVAISLIENEMLNAPWNKIYLTSYIKDKKVMFPTNIDIGEDLAFNLLVIKDISFVKVCNQSLVNYVVKNGEGLVSKFRPDRLMIRLSLLNQIKDILEYWGMLDQNKSMLDRMILRDFMACFMDLYKKTCKLSYKEKLEFIKDIVGREEKNIKKCSAPDLLTFFLKIIMNTKNSVVILLFAKIMSLKRGFR